MILLINSLVSILIPFVTVVTVTYNAGDYLEETILSVLNQKNINFEYIIIDGCSNDNTLKLISKYKTHITYWQSEPDRGIYDAMNKSLKFAKGEWICFMNAGDIFFNNDILFDFHNLNNLCDFNIVYGNHSFLKRNRLQIKIPQPLNSIWKKMPMCHQSIFTRTAILKSNPFNLNYKFASDYNFIYSQYLISPYKFLYINNVISIITTGGFSENNTIKTYIEYKRISISKNTSNLKKIYFNLRILERRLVVLTKLTIKKLYS